MTHITPSMGSPIDNNRIVLKMFYFFKFLSLVYEHLTREELNDDDLNLIIGHKPSVTKL